VFTNCKGDDDIDAKRSRPSIGKPGLGHAKKERVLLYGTDQRITSGPAAKRPRSKVGYMAAPERFAESQISLAPRAPSIHGLNEPPRLSPVMSANWAGAAAGRITTAAAVGSKTCHRQRD
jgi:hypothetical protein